jgi:hypothetical protein
VRIRPKARPAVAAAGGQRDEVAGRDPVAASIVAV